MWAWPPARPVVLLDVCDDTRCPPFRQQAMRKLVAELHHLHRQRSAQGPACLLHSPSRLLPRRVCHSLHTSRTCLCANVVVHLCTRT
jgi:hypothetical protein